MNCLPDPWYLRVAPQLRVIDRERTDDPEAKQPEMYETSLLVIVD